jgi:ribose transport system permease protein
MKPEASIVAAGRRAPDWRQVLVRYGFLIVIGGCFVFFAVWNPSFLGLGNLKNIAEGSAILLVVSLGMTLVVAQGGIDLSVGVALDFGSAFAIVAMKQFGADWRVAIAGAVVAGGGVGLLNALLVVRLAVSPFLATLGVYFIGGSLERIFTHGGGPISFRQLPEPYYAIGIGEFLGVPVKALIAAALAAIYYVVLERSIFGKRIHAIGVQPGAARVAGLKVDTYLAIGFVAAAATCAIAGVIASASLRMFTPLAGNAYLMSAVAAAFIGASIHPRGRPNVLGTVIGVLFLGMIVNGLDLMGLDFNLKGALSGIILVVALALAVAQKRLRR